MAEYVLNDDIQQYGSVISAARVSVATRLLPCAQHSVAMCVDN